MLEGTEVLLHSTPHMRFWYTTQGEDIVIVDEYGREFERISPDLSKRQEITEYIKALQVAEHIMDLIPEKEK